MEPIPCLRLFNDDEDFSDLDEGDEALGLATLNFDYVGIKVNPLDENDEKTLCVYIENKNNFDLESYVPSEYERVDENAYFKAMLEEMIHEKNRQLKDKHPNTLAVNILFNREWQTIKWNRLKIPSVCFYDIDSIIFFTNTIDSEKITVKMKIVNPSVQNRDGFCKIIEDTIN